MGIAGQHAALAFDLIAAEQVGTSAQPSYERLRNLQWFLKI